MATENVTPTTHQNQTEAGSNRAYTAETLIDQIDKAFDISALLKTLESRVRLMLTGDERFDEDTALEVVRVIGIAERCIYQLGCDLQDAPLEVANGF